MYAKLINPKMHGKEAYNNQGSASRALNYLTQEARRSGRDAVFFDGASEQVEAETLRHALDTNVKGLRANEAKFYSLVLSPSQAELSHIGNDEEKLRAYTRRVMADYAATFSLPGVGQGAVQEKDLVWGAIIHRERQHRGTDPAVRAGAARPGQPREGLQTHIHIVVSARDQAQKVTLNPGGRVRRFSLRDWQEQAGETFRQQFGYEGPRVARQARPAPAPGEYHAGRAARIAERVAKLNRQVAPGQELDAERVQQLGQGRGYDKIFYFRLRALEGRAAAGQPIDNAYHLLATGREQPDQLPAGHRMRQALHSFQQALRATNGPTQVETQEIGEQRRPQNDSIEL